MSFSDKVLGFGAFPNRETAYEIGQSLLMDNVYNNYFHRTPSSAGNQKTWTWSGWAKLGEAGVSDPQCFFGVGNGNASQSDSTWMWLGWYDDAFYVQTWSNTIKYVTNRKFRDHAAWYHFLVAVDTTNGTAGDRVRIYCNGVEETSFAHSTNPSLNADFAINSTNQHRVGRVNRSGTEYPLDGYLSEVHFIDGTALTPSSFGETDSTTGQWLPKEAEGLTYGTNGFYLKFAAGAIANDSSGEGNNYTANDLGDYSVRYDVPTNNFCTLNPLDKGSYATLLNGNLKNTASGYSTIADRRIVGTMGYHTSDTQGYYWEILYVDNAREDLQTIGVQKSGTTSGQGSSATNSFTSNEGQYGITWNAAEAMMIYYPYDPDNDPDGATTGGGDDNDGVFVGIAVKGSKIWIRINGSWRGDGDPAGDSDPFYTIPAAMAGHYLPLGAPWQGHSGGGGSAIDWRWNFGQDGTFWGAKTAQGNKDANGYGDFYYAVPTGFLALCSKNLPTPTITKGTDHFKSVIYTGNGSTQSISGVGFQPDLVWIKNRAQQDHHKLTDSVRGVTKELQSTMNTAEVTNADGLTGFGSDGFSLGDDDEYNTNTEAYVSWNWKASGSGSADTSADIDATVSANTTAGFSIVTWTANGSNTDTIPHGLGTTPKVVLYKQRATAASSWYWWTTAVDGSQDYLILNTTAAKADINTSTYGSLTSSTFTNFGYPDTNTMVAYCFAEVDGYSKFGSYEANNSTAGPFIFTGFTPAWLMIKYADGAGESWWMYDNKRNAAFNLNDDVLYANLTAVESSSGGVDFLSNGFKLRATSGGLNSANTYSYMVFGSSPFKYSNAR